MKYLLILFVALMPVTATFAQEKEGKKPSMELLELMFNEQVRAAAMPDLKIFSEAGLPEEGVEEVALAFEIYFDQATSDPVYLREMAGLFEKEFTAEDLTELVAFHRLPKAKDPKELAAFYETPLGQKTQATLPKLLKASLALGKEYNLKHREEVTEQVRGIMQQYKIPAREAPKDGEEK